MRQGSQRIHNHSWNVDTNSIEEDKRKRESRTSYNIQRYPKRYKTYTRRRKHKSSHANIQYSIINNQYAKKSGKNNADWHFSVRHKNKPKYVHAWIAQEIHHITSRNHTDHTATINNTAIMTATNEKNTKNVWKKIKCNTDRRPTEKAKRKEERTYNLQYWKIFSTWQVVKNTKWKQRKRNKHYSIVKSLQPMINWESKNGGKHM